MKMPPQERRVAVAVRGAAVEGVEVVAAGPADARGASRRERAQMGAAVGVVLGQPAD